MNYFHQVYERIREATRARTQVELAKVLGIKQSSISDAKRRGSIPADWFLTLFEERGINPDWLKKGTGPVFLRTQHGYFSDSTMPEMQGDGLSVSVSGQSFRQVPLHEAVPGVADCSRLPVVDMISLPQSLAEPSLFVARISHDVQPALNKNAIVGINTQECSMPVGSQAPYHLFALSCSVLGLRIHLVHNQEELTQLAPEAPGAECTVFGRVVWVFNTYSI